VFNQYYIYRLLRPYVFLLPILALMFGIFVSGLAMGFMQSVGYFPVLGLNNITLQYYLDVFANPAFVSALKFSLYTALFSSLVAVLVGIVLAYALLRAKSRFAIEQMVYKLPIIVPHTVAAFLVFSLMGQSGFISRLFYNLGWIQEISEFPSLIFDSQGIGIILAYVWKGIPFVALVVYGVLRAVDENYTMVSKNLGASSFQSFWYVIIPMIFPTLMSTFIILFAFSFGAFEVPFLLGPTNPKTLPVLAYIAYSHPDLTQRPYAMAMNMVLAGICFLLVFLYAKSYEVLAHVSKDQEKS
jgi:putative spermidine/putrescine transport system permease protein